MTGEERTHFGGIAWRGEYNLTPIEPKIWGPHMSTHTERWGRGGGGERVMGSGATEYAP